MDRRSRLLQRAGLAGAVMLTMVAVAASAPLDIAVVKVPGGGEPNGPDYDYYMGKYEITVAQYFAFLNDAEANQDNERGQYMLFDPSSGDVGIPDGSYLDGIFDISDCDTTFTYGPHYGVAYDANQPVGSRYVYDPNDANMPIVGVSWVGAVKFCNWLTINQGIDPNQRCYEEGPTVEDWYPVTISKIEWAERDLTDAERQDLVENYAGFRLPMDNIGLQNGFIDGQPNAYNEWYKAAAYDPGAPNATRTGEHGETIPPLHWEYGYGSDELDLTQANFTIYDSNQPGGVDPNTLRVPAPVGSYEGSSGNYYGIEDLSGNVYEWGQDYSNSISDPVRHATRGKAFNSGEPTAAMRHYRQIYNGTYFVGFRVVQCNSFALTVSEVNGHLGDVTVTPDQSTYAPGSLVTLTAVPNVGEQFSYWQGDLDAEDQLENPITVAMSQDRSISAVFGTPPVTYELTTSVTGQGSVSPSGASYVEEATAKLVATADPNWEFVEWQGDVSQAERTDNPLLLTMNQDRTVEAVFEQPPPVQYALTTSVEGQGSVDPNAGLYVANEELSVLALAADGWVFDRWSGDVAQEDRASNPLTLAMTRNRSIKAVFAEAPPPLYTLSTQIEGNGNVLPASGPYNQDASVRLIATPDSGWFFAGWSGDVPTDQEMANPLELTMDQDRLVTARFTEQAPAGAPGISPLAPPCVVPSAAMVTGLFVLGWGLTSTRRGGFRR